MACLNFHILIGLCLGLALSFSVYGQDPDLPCIPQKYDNKSLVCVCNATYCDTITRIAPHCRGFVSYTTSKDGKRFEKSSGRIMTYINILNPENTTVLEVDPLHTYQEISGFGTAATDSAGINWMTLVDHRARQKLIDSYFGKNGIEYNMIRLPIGGTDFSTRPYAYNDNDQDLNRFSLEPEDYEFKIPMVKACMDAATRPVRIVASIWSPPTWMKTEDSFISGYLRREHYQTLADYFCKFLESYKEFDIDIWGITTTNEPLNGIMANDPLNRLRWNVEDMGNWIANNLGPTIRNSTFKDIKIIAGDDQRFTLPLWFNLMFVVAPASQQYVDGVASHWYYDDFAPAELLSYALKDYSDKFLIYTEACEGFDAVPGEKVDLGSWRRAEKYANNILEVLNNGAIGWIDWNLCLDPNGGPNWVENFVDSPIIVSADTQEFYKQPMFYIMGHFSKFIPRGSRNIKLENLSNSASLPSAAFLTPENTIVVVILNTGMKQEVIIRRGLDHARVIMEENTITTVEFHYKNFHVIGC